MRNLRLTLWVLASVMVLWSFSGVAMAERVALVVGNSAYQHTSRLRNPINDATAMAKALEELKFEVIFGEDLDRDSFFGKLEEFRQATKIEGVALFFYAGHGAQYNSSSYLAPIDAKLASENDYVRWHIGMDAVFRSMQSKIKLVFLDACRNNPLETQLIRTPTSRGLVRVSYKSNNPGSTYIAYATAENATAADGKKKHPPSTKALLEHLTFLQHPNRPVSVGDMVGLVSAAVFKETGGRQEPWGHGTGAPVYLPRIGVPSKPPGVYLKVGVGVGQKVEESHLEVVAKGRISEGEIGEYSMIRGGCYSGGMSAGTRLGWEHIQSSCTR